MFHFRAPHPVRMLNHRPETLFMNCPLDGEAYNIRRKAPNMEEGRKIWFHSFALTLGRVNTKY